MDGVDNSTSVLLPRAIGPYRIEALLGRGGPGEVYRAKDRRLGRRVAIKRIRAEYSRHPGFRKRFEREARMVASLDHPSIVRIFDVLRSEDGDQWIVMELVDGLSVIQLLQNGPLELKTAAAIGLDVIRGLEQAHARGILHRDLKAENVLLSSAGVAKILDFGLSKWQRSTEEASLSQDGKLIGTWRVMAPEQARGQTIDPRADLFSFGILLYEMVTGHSPFLSDTPMTTLLKITDEPHTPAQERDPSLPDELSRLIDRLLEKEPDDRPASASEVATELGRIGTSLTDQSDEMRVLVRAAAGSRPEPGGPMSEDEVEALGSLESEVPWSAPIPVVWSTDESSRDRLLRTVKRRSWVLGALVGVTALLVAGWFRLSRAPHDVVELEDPRIVVLPFEYQGPAERSFLAPALTHELIRELASSKGVAVVSHRTADYFGNGDWSLSQIGEELGVEYVLEGSVLRTSGEAEPEWLQLAVDLTRVADGRVLISRSVERSLDRLRSTYRRLAEDVAAELGAQILADQNRDLSVVPMALESYFRGLVLLHGSGYSIDVVEDAEILLREAVEKDPGLVQAWTELSRIRSWIYYNLTGTPEGRAAAIEATRRALALAPDAPSSLVADGYLQYQVLDDFDAALQKFQRASELAPNDPRPMEGMGFVLRRLGRLPKATEIMERAFSLDRANDFLAGFLAESRRAQRAFDLAESWYAVAVRINPKSPRILGDRSENTLARFGCGEFKSTPKCSVDAALRVLDDSEIHDRATLWESRVHLAWYDSGRADRWTKFLAVFDSFSEPELPLGARGFQFWRKVLALRWSGRAEEAQALAGRYQQELAERVAIDARWHYRAPLGMALALLDRDDESWAQMQLALKDAANDRFSGPRVEKWAARTALLAGRLQQARERLSTCASTDYQDALASYELHADPIWQPLRDAGLLDDIWADLRQREMERARQAPP